MKKVTMICDLQFGSTGKGLIAGYWAEKEKPDTVINANMPNAGHTYINREGRKWVHKVLPNGIVSPKLKRVMIGPQSVFSLEQLHKELDDSADLLEGKVIMIHQDAIILQPDHRLMEQATLSGISSTMQGSGVASIEKMRRLKDCDNRATTWEPSLRQMSCWVVNNVEWLSALRSSGKILAEAAQGYSLGLNAGFWPYCTSRDCTPARFASDMGIPWSWIKDVIGTARVHPIRVGNTPDGYSGDVYPDQKEMRWEEIGVAPELTTVTQRERRIFTWSWLQFAEAMFYVAPTKIFLNFCNYDEELADFITEKIKSSYLGAEVKYAGFGPAFQDIQEL